MPTIPPLFLSPLKVVAFWLLPPPLILITLIILPMPKWVACREVSHWGQLTGVMTVPLPRSSSSLFWAVYGEVAAYSFVIL